MRKNIKTLIKAALVVPGLAVVCLGRASVIPKWALVFPVLA